MLDTQSFLKQAERRYAKTVGLGVLCLALGLSSIASPVWAMGRAPNEAEKQAAKQDTKRDAASSSGGKGVQGASGGKGASANACELVLANFNQQELKQQIDVAQLSEIVRHLDAHKRLPNYFVTKKLAAELGWSPGTYFNSVPALRGKSIGGDRFGNFERRLPQGQWQEADLDYRGKKRNAKRIVFSRDGDRYVTIDHYDSFKKVPTCQ